MLQNLFPKELSDLRREMKDLIRTKVTVNTAQVSDIKKLLGVDENLKFLREDYRNKDNLISILLESSFEREITNVSCKDKKNQKLNLEISSVY